MNRTAREAPVRAARRAAMIGLRACILMVAIVTLAIGLAALVGSGLGKPQDPDPGIAVWSWIFGASGCARVLALAAEGRWTGMSLMRLACGVVGLMSWSQLTWLLVESLATSAAVAAGGLGLFAIVALSELHSIYRAAHDARFDDP